MRKEEDSAEENAYHGERMKAEEKPRREEIRKNGYNSNSNSSNLKKAQRKTAFKPSQWWWIYRKWIATSFYLCYFKNNL